VRSIAIHEFDVDRAAARRIAWIGLVVEANALADAQSIEAVGLDRGAVEKQILRAGRVVARDEAEPFVAHAGDRAGSHVGELLSATSSGSDVPDARFSRDVEL